MNAVQVAVLPGGAGPPAIAPTASAPRRESVSVQLAAFFALGLYGILRWDTMLSGSSFGRLFGLLALSAALSVIGPLLARFSRWLAAAVFVLGLWAAFAIAGLPLDWVVHLRLAVSSQAIGDGLSALPQINLPYIGIDQWVRVTLLLGAMILMLDAALVLTFVPRRLGLLRRAGAALPLIALAVIPATALRPRGPYVEGALLFALVVAFVWGDRIQSRRLGSVLAPCAVAVVVAVGLAPALDRHQAWINYQRLAASLTPGGVESFNWTQGYGPLHWPHTGKAVMYVQAPHRDYWKAENLDVFNGQGWAVANSDQSPPWQTGVSRSAIRRWSQTIQVTLDAMSTFRVISDGSTTSTPKSLPGTALAGTSPGTFVSARRLEPGASYRVTTYAPHPSSAQLATAGASYPPGVAAAYLSMTVPVIPGLSGAAAAAYPNTGLITQVVFPPFDDRHAALVSTEGATPVASLLASSPYSQVYALAQRLKAQAPTPYAYVGRVLRYLAHGFRYSQTPTSSRYPLETFLVVNKLGYCQHFAGAMALLLRMGGVPARVAVGFTPGTYDQPSHRWVVSDLDAHAWVEAWFPSYGWVRFDPTPTVDPALAPTVASQGADVGSNPKSPGKHGLGKTGSSRVHRARAATAGRGSGVSALIVAPATVLALLVLLALLTRVRSSHDPVGELSRAFARSGRPLEKAATLSALERRLAYSPEAAGYVRALRLAKYGRGSGAAADGPWLGGRRALRRALRMGLGPLGRVRAWWALPPRWHWPRRGGGPNPAP